MLVMYVLSLLFFVSLARGLLILVLFSENQFLALFIFSIVFLFLILFTFCSSSYFLSSACPGFIYLFFFQVNFNSLLANGELSHFLPTQWCYS